MEEIYNRIKQSNQVSHYGRQNSDTKPSGEKEEREDEGVDAKADDFINRFKKQLRLQRIDSIVRYKEMISRTFA
ncbi:Solute carrier family 43 member 3, partial [Bienertia sinuspersici]